MSREALLSLLAQAEMAKSAILEATDELTCLEQALSPGSPRLLYCASCGSTVRLTEKLADSLGEAREKPLCVACHGDLT